MGSSGYVEDGEIPVGVGAIGEDAGDGGTIGLHPESSSANKTVQAVTTDLSDRLTIFLPFPITAESRLS